MLANCVALHAVLGAAADSAGEQIRCGEDNIGFGIIQTYTVLYFFQQSGLKFTLKILLTVFSVCLKFVCFLTACMYD